MNKISEQMVKKKKSIIQVVTVENFATLKKASSLQNEESH